jgi:hypothetical protein
LLGIRDFGCAGGSFRASLGLDLHRQSACNLAPELAYLTVVLDLPRGLLEAHLEQLPATLTEVKVEVLLAPLA